MKAVILAAGKGTRLLPLTENIPKVLVEVNGKPFLSYVIDNLKKAGITELGIIVGFKKEKIVRFLKENNIQATLIEQKEQLGTGHAVLQAKEFCGNDNFLALGGDNLFSVKDLLSVKNDDNLCYLLGKEVEEWKKYGVLVVEDGKLLKIIEKPQDFVGRLINAGLYKFPPGIWGALDKMELSARGEYELTDAISLLAKEGKVKVLKLQDYWLDLGCKGDIAKIELFLSKS
jgi:dTDP-glucose pyrophosphorylase